MALTGGCICGKVRYEIKDDPLFVHACHCTDCQRFSGSAFVVLLGVVKADFEVHGETSTVTNPTPSGSGYDAHFCPNCATIIWSKYHFVDIPVISLRGGTLDETEMAQPAYHIFVRSKQPWVILPDDTPVFDGWLEPTEAWSKTTLNKIEEMTQ